MTCYGPPSRPPRASRCARRVCVRDKGSFALRATVTKGLSVSSHAGWSLRSWGVRGSRALRAIATEKEKRRGRSRPCRGCRGAAPRGHGSRRCHYYMIPCQPQRPVSSVSGSSRAASRGLGPWSRPAGAGAGRSLAHLAERL